MILHSTWSLVFLSTLVIYGACLDHLNELPDCSRSYDSNYLQSTLFVSTLDGRVTALNANAGGIVVWSIVAGPEPLLSSSIHKLELTNNGHWVRMIPSLSGGLYKFNGANIEMLPVKADHLLQSSSLLSSDGLVISGGRETSLYSVALETGEILYECSMTGCDNLKNISSDMIIIQRHSQTVRAIDIHTGNERWNFSVGQHELKLASNSADCHVNRAEHPEMDIKAIIPEGLVYAVQKSPPHNILWRHKFPSPIVAIWKMEYGQVHTVDLFHENVWSTAPEDAPNMAPALYLGMHQKQLYIQESISLQSNIRKSMHLIENVSMNLHIPWEPIAVTSMTLGAMTRPMIDSDNEDAPTTALSVLYASEYVNGNGYFLFNKNTDLMKADEQCSPSEELNISDARGEFENDQETPIHIIVSLWFWWKEVLVISITTAVLVNVIVTQRVLQLVQEPIEKGVVIEEKPTPVGLETAAKATSSRRSNSFEPRNAEYISRYLLDFEPVQCLGKGGFGVVFEAKNKIDECNYAIKRIALPNSLESRDRVLREVKALAKLDHQHIVRYFNAWMECPPRGWQEYHDSMHTKTFCSESGIPTYMHSHEETSNIADEINSEGNSQFLLNETKRFSSVTMPTTPSCEENDSFIIFESSQSYGIHEQTEHISVDLDGTLTDESSSHSHENLKCQSSQWSEDLCNKIAPSPTRMYLYIQMQLCLKESLREWLCENVTNRDRKKMLQIFEQILQAVEYIHLEGLIHRDLKPSNIFFSMNGQIKVGDFGLVTTMTENVTSKLCETKPKFEEDRKHTDKVGTQLYMSPEQVKGLPYDYKVDIYSLGVILFELLYPFSTQMERSNVLLALRKNTFPDSFIQEFQEEYVLLRLMLAHNPERRPTTFGIRARAPLSESFSANEEEASAQWHFTLPLHSRSTNNLLPGV